MEDNDNSQLEMS